MIRRVLVPLEGESDLQAVLPYIGALQEKMGASITLFQVLLYGTDRRLKKASAFLVAAMKKLPRNHVFTKTEAGDPAPAILKCIAQERFDLILLCSRGRVGIKRALMGSVAEEVLRSCSIPMLIIPPDRHQGSAAFQHILLPMDGSARAAGILGPVRDFAGAFGSKVTMLHVDESTGGKDTLVSRVKSMRAELQESGAFEVDLEIRTGFPGEEISQAAVANHTDLIAIATHGRTGLDRIYNGSVAEEVLRRGTLPLLVLRTGPVVVPAGEKIPPEVRNP